MTGKRMKGTICILAALAALAGFSHGAQARNCLGLGDAYYNDDATGKCYYSEDTAPLAYSAAQSACVANGGNLVTIDSASKQAFIYSTFTNNDEYYIGATDLAQEDRWVWGPGPLDGTHFWQGQAGGAAVDNLYSNWNSGEPNGSTEDCATTIRSANNGEWNDVICTDARTYICEIPACANPEGSISEIIFNQDARTLQYCNGGLWIPMAQPTYSPTAVMFDGVNDYLTSAAAQAVDSQQITGSVWVKYNGAVNIPYPFISQNGGTDFRLRYSGGSGNRFEVLARDNGGTVIMQVRCGGGIPTPGVWYHYLFSMDMTDVNRRSCYVDDVSSSNFLTYTTGTTMSFDLPNARIGANHDAGASQKINASIADMWVDFGTYIDFSVAANRRKFIDAAGRPADLGSDGSLPTGGQPEIFLSGGVGSWHTNKGTATGYTLTGLLDTDTAPGAMPGSNVTSGLVGYWTFDDASGSTTAANSIAGGLSGTLTNMTPASDWVAGKIGGALDFDGTNDRVVVDPHDAVNNLSPVTWCAWIYPRALPGGSFPALVDKSTNAGGTDGFNFYLTGTGGQLGYYSNLGDYKQRTPSVTLNVWQHVCASWDGSDGTADILMYLNGVLSNTGTDQGTTVVSNNDALIPLKFGGAPGASQYFNGLMDDVRVYNRVLSAGEIQGLYEWGENSGHCSNPVRGPGTIVYNADSHVPQFCDGASWRALGPVPGPGGAGCANPSRGEGHILFNSATRTMQYCDGVTWRGMSGMALGAPTAGLVHHWPMEDGAAAMTIDDVIGSNDCTVQINGGTRFSVAGKVGNALRYQDSYAQCGVIAAMHDTTQFTLSAWLRRNSAGDNVYVFEEGGGTSQMGIDFYGNGETYFTLTNPPSSGYEEGNFPLNDTQWHLITMVYDGSLTGDANRLKGYINGQQVTLNFNGSGIIDAVTGPYATAAQLRLYNLIGTADGSIDDIRVYNRALSAAEVSQLYYATGGQ